MPDLNRLCTDYAVGGALAARWRPETAGEVRRRLALEEAPDGLGSLKLRDVGVEVQPIERAALEEGVVLE